MRALTAPCLLLCDFPAPFSAFAYRRSDPLATSIADAMRPEPLTANSLMMAQKAVICSRFVAQVLYRPRASVKFGVRR